MRSFTRIALSSNHSEVTKKVISTLSPLAIREISLILSSFAFFDTSTEIEYIFWFVSTSYTVASEFITFSSFVFLSVLKNKEQIKDIIKTN